VYQYIGTSLIILAVAVKHPIYTEKSNISLETVVVALIAASGLSTMVYAVPE
jgi:hypothetical protein